MGDLYFHKSYCLYRCLCVGYIRLSKRFRTCGGTRIYHHDAAPFGCQRGIHLSHCQYSHDLHCLFRSRQAVFHKEFIASDNDGICYENSPKNCDYAEDGHNDCKECCGFGVFVKGVKIFFIFPYKREKG